MNNQIVILSPLRKDILSALHCAYQGVTSMQLRVNTTVYWPGMNRDIRTTRYNRIFCNEIAPKQQQEPLVFSILAISTNLCRLFWIQYPSFSYCRLFQWLAKYLSLPPNKSCSHIDNHTEGSIRFIWNTRRNQYWWRPPVQFFHICSISFHVAAMGVGVGVGTTSTIIGWIPSVKWASWVRCQSHKVNHQEQSITWWVL